MKKVRGVISVTEADLIKETLKGITIAIFWAQGCHHSETLFDGLHLLVKKHGNRVKFVSLMAAVKITDGDWETVAPAIEKLAHVKRYPTVATFFDGQFLKLVGLEESAEEQLSHLRALIKELEGESIAKAKRERDTKKTAGSHVLEMAHFGKLLPERVIK